MWEIFFFQIHAENDALRPDSDLLLFFKKALHKIKANGECFSFDIFWEVSSWTYNKSKLFNISDCLVVFTAWDIEQYCYPVRNVINFENNIKLSCRAVFLHYHKRQNKNLNISRNKELLRWNKKCLKDLDWSKQNRHFGRWKSNFRL